MGRTFCSDRGNVMRGHNEELTRWRWARKRFDLPAGVVDQPADVWLLAAPYAETRVPLSVTLNGRRIARLRPLDPGDSGWAWRRVATGDLSQRCLELVLEAETPAMNAWRLGIDNTVSPRDSALSFDRGRTWQNSSMGAHQCLSGEYVIRIRSHATSFGESPPPAVVCQTADHPRCRDLVATLPRRIRSQGDPWKQLLALRTWVSTRWSHDPFGQAYCPWDAATILDWVKRDQPHGQKGRVAMCVQFAVVFAQFASALGHQSRCLAITHEINSMYGHFVAEVFDDARARWIVHDANYDVHYEDGEPLGVTQLADRALDGVSLVPLVRSGPGMPKRPARLMRVFRSHFATGKSYRRVAVWRRNNLISDPTGMPPNHGSLVYAETDLIWYDPACSGLAPMFPYRVRDADEMNRPPTSESG